MYEDARLSEALHAWRRLLFKRIDGDHWLSVIATHERVLRTGMNRGETG